APPTCAPLTCARHAAGRRDVPSPPGQCSRPGCLAFFIMSRRRPTPPLFPYTTLFRSRPPSAPPQMRWRRAGCACSASRGPSSSRSEEHTSELQSLTNLVCRLLLEKKKQTHHKTTPVTATPTIPTTTTPPPCPPPPPAH